jgi:hypothetical protein
MKETVISFIDQMELDGKRLSDVKDKKVMPGRIACALRDMRVDGWVNLDHYHLNVHCYPMYKSLYDLFNTELKAKLTYQKLSRTDEVVTSSKNSPLKQENKSGEQLTEKNKPGEVATSPKEETKDDNFI